MFYSYIIYFINVFCIETFLKEVWQLIYHFNIVSLCCNMQGRPAVDILSIDIYPTVTRAGQ